MYQIQNILCEHMHRPLAVTAAKPRFSWEWKAEENNVYQSAYQIMVYEEDGSIVWNSTKTAGRNTIDIEYAGQPLKSKRPGISGTTPKPDSRFTARVSFWKN